MIWCGVIIGSWLVAMFCWGINMRTLRRTIRERDEATELLIAAGAFLQAMEARGIGLRCDDCGNIMDRTSQIDIIEKDDGTIYVGHRSHNRRIDWGYTTS